MSIGTQRRTNYTRVSNATNLAARLDSYSKVLGKPILIDKTTRHALSENIRVQDEGLVDIRGKVRQAVGFAWPIVCKSTIKLNTFYKKKSQELIQ